MEAPLDVEEPADSPIFGVQKIGCAAGRGRHEAMRIGCVGDVESRHEHLLAQARLDLRVERFLQLPDLGFELLDARQQCGMAFCLAHVGGEIVHFRTATQTGPGQYTLRGTATTL
ncbi:hypothetical protein [Burkholderia sp. MSMB1589WGS]|uniref:hypothetical protein n=1 Tax=Burkholderia sp. MSMB1589WGS TaxID=1636425 RepID=UPI000A87CFA1|nr:hypothetical protein [Burkholderia sp. MSMB1589WGS]